MSAIAQMDMIHDRDMAARARRRLRRDLVLVNLPPALAILVVLVVAIGLVISSTGAGTGSEHHTPAYVPGDRSGRIGIGAAMTSLLIEPSDGVRPLIGVIDRTQRSLYVECYILTDRQIIRALERAAAQDVAVRVLLEPHPLGMGTQPRRVADELAAAGVSVRWTRRAFALTHAKFMVSDDRVTVIASANFSHAGFHGNRDLVLIDREPSDVRLASSVFRADWDGSTPGAFDANVVMSPDNARARISSLVRDARHSVAIYAEELGDGGVERLLAATGRHGVLVRIILAAGQSTSQASWLVAHGVAVRSLSRPYVHAKMILVDERESFVGSENLSTQSLDLNRELGVLVRGSIVRRLEETFEADWKRATPVIG
jgi:phosphatidylserine/phosphatidylglycerophosphate/cardiolipin synthase-like enzyme